MRYQNTQDLYDTYISFCKRKIHTITNHAFCSFSNNLLNRRFARVANPDQPMNGGQHCPFPSTSAIFYRPATQYWREARHRLSLQFQVMSKYLLRQTQKRKNLALSLLTGLRKKRTKFLKRRCKNLVSCGEFHKQKKSNSGVRVQAVKTAVSLDWRSWNSENYRRLPLFRHLC